MSVNDFSIDPLQFFEGPTEGWGIFEDVTGKLRREFSIEMFGRLEGGDLILDETIRYDDGSDVERQWTLARRAERGIIAKAPDIIGEAQGETDGRLFTMRYTMRFPMNGRSITFDLKDRYLLREQGVIINRAKLSKFGLPIGQIYGTFRRIETQAETRLLQAAE